MKIMDTDDPMGKKTLFLSADWGTSSLRIRLVDAATGQVISEDRSGMGIRQCFLSWRETKDTDPGKRISFYLDIIRGALRNMEESLDLPLQGIPLVLSGMASSSAGMLELPYREIPFDIYHEDLITEWLPAGAGPGAGVLLISGLKSGDDVMRGEETQLIGCLSGPGGFAAEAAPDHIMAPDVNIGDGLYIFPGTHSKHILVKDGTIIGFKTFMTGEIFELLSEKSLLAGSVEKTRDRPGDRDWASFRRGVLEASGANFLQVAFHTRVNDLFGLLSKKENFYYLSGLLIGTELQDLPAKDAKDIYLCCGNALKDHYEKALELMNVCERVHIFPAELVDLAAVQGQWAVLSRTKTHNNADGQAFFKGKI
ncbi:MAG TPA: 2-dehydro-3-deoxygalactonokinase [Puia sp.]|nr:2-dehydro-3-deoxygalactonokinase [Puia sp.]